MDQKKIGAFIAQLRQERGLTQSALGDKLGVTNKTVSRWENGNYMPDVSLLQPLSDALGVGVNELLAGERILQDRDYRQRADEAVLAIMRDQFSRPHRRAFWRQKWLREHVLFLMLGLLGCGGGLAVLAWLDSPLLAAAIGCAAFGLYAHGQLAAYLESKENHRDEERKLDE